MTDSSPYWLEKPLEDMTPEEWESLCDGCGWCCMRKIEDSETGEVFHTKVGCRFLDPDGCHCTYYERRGEANPDCVHLTPDAVPNLSWLPSTCAYRLLAEGCPLPSWHPLITGDPQSVHAVGMSARGSILNEDEINDYEENYMRYVLFNLK